MLNPPHCLLCSLRRSPSNLQPGFCASTRPDLEPAYGANHPLRVLPADRGESCTHFKAWP